eukprot:294549_1
MDGHDQLEMIYPNVIAPRKWRLKPSDCTTYFMNCVNRIVCRETGQTAIYLGEGFRGDTVEVRTFDEFLKRIDVITVDSNQVEQKEEVISRENRAPLKRIDVITVDSNLTYVRKHHNRKKHNLKEKGVIGMENKKMYMTLSDATNPRPLKPDEMVGYHDVDYDSEN